MHRKQPRAQRVAEKFKVPMGAVTPSEAEPITPEPVPWSGAELRRRVLGEDDQLLVLVGATLHSSSIQIANGHVGELVRQASGQLRLSKDEVAGLTGMSVATVNKHLRSARLESEGGGQSLRLTKRNRKPLRKLFLLVAIARLGMYLSALAESAARRDFGARDWTPLVYVAILHAIVDAVDTAFVSLNRSDFSDKLVDMVIARPWRGLKARWPDLACSIGVFLILHPGSKQRIEDALSSCVNELTLRQLIRNYSRDLGVPLDLGDLPDDGDIDVVHELMQVSSAPVDAGFLEARRAFRDLFVAVVSSECPDDWDAGEFSEFHLDVEQEADYFRENGFFSDAFREYELTDPEFSDALRILIPLRARMLGRVAVGTRTIPDVYGDSEGVHVLFELVTEIGLFSRAPTPTQAAKLRSTLTGLGLGVLDEPIKNDDNKALNGDQQ